METVLEAMRNEGWPAAGLVVEKLLAARDRLATLVDDLENSNQADLQDLLAQLERVERSIKEAAEEWDIDLRELSRRRSGRLVEFFFSLARFGVVTAPSVDVGQVDLSHGLPRGPVRFRAKLAPETPRDEIRRSLGLADVASTREPERSLPLSINLADWVRAERPDPGDASCRAASSGEIRGPPARFPPGQSGRGLRHRSARPARPPADGAVCRTTSTVGSGFPCESRRPSRRERRLAPALAESSVPASRPAPAIAEHPTSIAGSRGAPAEPDRTASLRINVELLDRLMTLTSELTLIRNQSLLAFDQDDSQLRPIVQRLDAVTSALQETVLRTRMQPIGNLFGKFPRVVRDLGRQLGKQVEMTIIGREVELDKTILEQLSDPLTHLVRNSVDHGIEPPDDRVARGKPAIGRITLSAAHEEGQIRIEIRDDGRGIDPQAVRDKALAMRLKTEAELDRMSPREIFLADPASGLLDGATVTEVSGRGVGMDVVKTNIELLEGSLTIDSHPGLGTAMILRMPLTLAIIPCLIVTVGGERYAIPQRDLEEADLSAPRAEGANRARVRHRGISVARPTPADRAVQRGAPPPAAFHRGDQGGDPLRACRDAPGHGRSRTSWSCGQPAAVSGWSWMRSGARRRSSSSRCMPRSRRSTSSPARRSWATAASR